MRRPTFRPLLTRLEPRDLPATGVAKLVATPSLLSPPDNRLVRVEVTGRVEENRLNVRPQVDFQVVDEYRRVEPSGRVKLTPVSASAYTFKFPVYLQARRSGQDKAGRQYYVIVVASDLDNAQGLVVPVLVPFRAVKSGPAMVRSSAHIKPRNEPR